jgi:hypothetical protein
LSTATRASGNTCPLQPRHLEEYARELIVEEELHSDEVNKMLRRPGQTDAFSD